MRCGSASKILQDPSRGPSIGDLQSSGRMASGLHTNGQPNSSVVFQLLAPFWIIWRVSKASKHQDTWDSPLRLMQNDGDSSILTELMMGLSAPLRAVLKLGAE